MAKDKVLMGPERRSMIISENDKRVTAFHEAGHALVGKMMKGSDPVHKVTIIPRGRALGLTQQLPIEDRLNLSKDGAEDQIAVPMGGRVAEELVFGQMTTGASNDIQVATDLARKMVCEWGMSDKLGPLHFGRREEMVFLGRDFAEQQGLQRADRHRDRLRGPSDRHRELRSGPQGGAPAPREAEGAGRGAARVRDRSTAPRSICSSRASPSIGRRRPPPQNGVAPRAPRPPRRNGRRSSRGLWLTRKKPEPRSNRWAGRAVRGSYSARTGSGGWPTSHP